MNISPELEASIIKIESQWWEHVGSKEFAIKEASGLSPVRWYQSVNQWIDTESAMINAPILTKRLRRLRERRQQSRAQRGQVFGLLR